MIQRAMHRALRCQQVCSIGRVCRETVSLEGALSQASNAPARTMHALSLATHCPVPFGHWLMRNQPSLPSVAMRSTLRSPRCGDGSNISRLRALRADVLRRAVSQLNTQVSTLSNRSGAPRAEDRPHMPVPEESQEWVAVLCLPDTRPNPSIEGTHNGGAQCPASSRVVPPLCAPHVKR
jgi:hypothetical protein